MSIKKNIVFEATEKQDEFIKAVFSGKYTTLLYGGAIRSGKTFVSIALAILLCRIFPRSRWTIVRKDLKRLKDNTRPSLDKFIEGSGWKVIEGPTPTFISPEGSKIIFKGENYDRDKTLESFKGHETNGFILEEVSEIREATFYKCLERAGSYLIRPEPEAGQPPPFIFMTCNPTQSWIKKLMYDPWKNGVLPKHMYYQPAYPSDNPYLPKSYTDNLENLPQYEYEVFVKGNWDITLKTDNAFWHAIDVNTHIKPVFYDDTTTVLVSIDSNNLPYCAASLWQVFPNEKRIVQFHEILGKPRDIKEKDSRDENHAGGLASLVSEYLQSIDYSDMVMVYGDATTKAQNTIDEKKRSFFDIFMEQLRENHNALDNLGRKNPQISKTGEFVNALYSGFDGWVVEIGETCKESISDYLTVKKDMDGTMLKKRVTDDDGNSYEKAGHLSDCKRYIIFECLNSVYTLWDNRFSPAPETYMEELKDVDIFDEDIF